jgi:Uma2 family endonuclease
MGGHAAMKLRENIHRRLAHGSCSSGARAGGSIMEAVPVESPPVTNQPMRRLKRREYDALVAQGAFENERVELVFGTVVAMSPIDPSHVRSTTLLAKMLTVALADRAEVLCQQPIAATDDSEPEPDIYVTGPGSWTAHATRACLVIEVARTSLAYDRGENALLYGISDVDEYWIVDLANGLIEVRKDRDRGTWRSIRTFRRGESVAMLAFPDVTVDVAAVLPPV